MKLRPGTTTGYTVYLQLGERPTDTDALLGLCVSQEAAAEIVRVANHGIDTLADGPCESRVHDYGLPAKSR